MARRLIVGATLMSATAASAACADSDLAAVYAAMDPPVTRADWHIHDPSRVVTLPDGRQMIAVTGKENADGYTCGLETWLRADARARWEPGACLFTAKPDWIAEELPSNAGAFWAPGLIDAETMVYSVSADDMAPGSCTGSARRTAAGWRDNGAPITCSFTPEGPGEVAAIDPSTFTGLDGRSYLVLGGGTIHATEFDPELGTINAPDWFTPGAQGWSILAHGPDRADEAWVEAAFVHPHPGTGWHYLFVNWGTCCAGVASTYEIRVGRSRDPLGPYLDTRGRDLRDGGGTLVYAGEGPEIGPGHAAVWTGQDGTTRLSYHFYDAARDGLPWIGERVIDWPGGWPVLR